MRIPSVHELKERLAKLLPEVPFSFFTEPARMVAQTLREKKLKEGLKTISDKELDRLLLKAFEDYHRPHLRRVINATGIIIHTNLGRAPLPSAAIIHLLDIGPHYSNLEYNLEEGKRGSRYEHVEGILRELTNAEGALVVNNNASAVLISLNTLAQGKEVIVSRGELVEIGGSFRIPEVMRWAGCILKEVGTTNKTHLHDYENAINENTALLLKVHKSNYAIVGFTKEVSTEELVALGKKRGLPVMEDLGSGCFIDFSKYGLSKEPTVQEVVKAGVDVVTFSGDKLLGGPQAGIILGKKEFIERIRKNPLNRAIRIDKFTLAMLEYILKLYRDEAIAINNIPVLEMIFSKPDDIKKKAQRLKRNINALGLPLEDLKIVQTTAKTGGGALPLLDLPSYGVALKIKDLSPQGLHERLRKANPPIIAIAEEDYLVFDARCLFDQDLNIIPEILKQICNELGFTS
ncbi:selenocysteine synthase [Caldimicrobium thiodismutans]|jgi:L-seryl-tRNA(Ser) seleniumtransferase|uniref:L-seryl-tRNA(Sec) selenium transferase n=1 Tax=Caldimicrobium thiodismutans TaxID=1653476 RepID=A0A0U5AGA0_9BACT|nr:L-seryl-tRNA(Sec) selenium transferase [Caldimicrobium thiodismutans]BAU23020.1 selenocysteine synthase [Caldimicrobium thiodismutans]